jgi:hypothetical protein
MLNSPVIGTLVRAAAVALLLVPTGFAFADDGPARPQAGSPLSSGQPAAPRDQNLRHGLQAANASDPYAGPMARNNATSTQRSPLIFSNAPDWTDPTYTAH